jgi:hypothetical protein
VFVSDADDPPMSGVKHWDFLVGNFFIGNYGTQESVDNDDGSAYYITTNNVIVYPRSEFGADTLGGMKSDFGGHDNIWTDN